MVGMAGSKNHIEDPQPRIGVNRSGGLFTENTVCIFDGPRKHVDLLGMNNYRILATTQQYERRLMLITASRGRVKEKEADKQ